MINELCFIHFIIYFLIYLNVHEMELMCKSTGMESKELMWSRYWVDCMSKSSSKVKRDYTLPTLLHRVSRMGKNNSKCWKTLRRDCLVVSLSLRVSRWHFNYSKSLKAETRFTTSSTACSRFKTTCEIMLSAWNSETRLPACHTATSRFRFIINGFLASNFKWLYQWFPCTFAPQHFVIFDFIKSIPNWFNIKPTLRSKWRRQSTYRYIYILREQPEKRTNTEKFLALHWNNLYVANLVIY